MAVEYIYFIVFAFYNICGTLATMLISSIDEVWPPVMDWILIIAVLNIAAIMTVMLLHLLSFLPV